MNKLSKTAEGLAAWLTYERRCGRHDLFSESYLAQPLGQLLKYQYSNRIIPEYEHTVLATRAKGRGRRPRFDFAVVDATGHIELAIETKWVSDSPNLIRDMLRDLVRLDLLLPSTAKQGVLILAGQKTAMQKLFTQTAFRPHPEHHNSKTILPLAADSRSTVRFLPVSKYRRQIYQKALAPFVGLDISQSMRLERYGPFPRQSRPVILVYP